MKYILYTRRRRDFNKVKLIIGLLGTEVATLVIWFTIRGNLELFFMAWTFATALAAYFSATGGPMKNACTEAYKGEFFDKIRRQYTLLKNYNRIPDVVKEGINYVFIILLMSCLLNIGALIVVSVNYR